jgi:hypothetical protein
MTEWYFAVLNYYQKHDSKILSPYQGLLSSRKVPRRCDANRVNDITEKYLRMNLLKARSL